MSSVKPILLSGIFLIASGAALAQQGPAKLYRVDDGIFELKLGQSIDLTERKVLVNFDYHSRLQSIAEYKTFRVLVNGWYGGDVHPGVRLDLKKYYSTAKIVADTSECYLDIVDVATPKGGTPVATFRFSCR